MYFSRDTYFGESVRSGDFPLGLTVPLQQGGHGLTCYWYRQHASESKVGQAVFKMLLRRTVQRAPVRITAAAGVQQVTEIRFAL